MKLSLKSVAVVSTLSVLAVSSVLLNAPSASAQPTGMRQSYVGAGISAGVLDDGQAADVPIWGGNVQARYAIPKAPISLRGSAIFNDQAVALVPTVTYDLPVNNRTNLYLGVGYSFIPGSNKVTPLGNQDTVVFSPGVETSINKNLVLYSDAKIGLNGFKNGDATAMSVQVGAGYRF